MRKGFLATMFVWAAAFMCCLPSVHAGEVDLLVQKLVEKNILSANEAQILLDDTRQEVAKQNALGKNAMLPAWIQTVKLKGDVRLRFQDQKQKGTTLRHDRGRVRMRLGLEAKPSEQFTVGAGMASGSDADARSTNETLGDGFAKDGVYLDYAWAEYKPEQWLSMIGGKYNANGKKYLWYTTDMLWDSDINQEGVSAHVDLPKVMMGEPFLNAGYWTLSESGSANIDAYMLYGQAGMKYDIDAGLESPLNLAFAGTYYNKNWDSAHTALNNGKDTQTNNLYEYRDVVSGSAELVYKWPEETSCPIKMVGIFGDYVTNLDADSDNTGWATGLKFGYPKLGGAKTWQFKYQYVKLEQYAWPDVFPDSDRYSGKTDVKAHEAILDIGLSKNVSLGLDYYHAERILAAKKPENVYQVDMVFKF